MGRVGGKGAGLLAVGAGLIAAVWAAVRVYAEAEQHAQIAGLLLLCCCSVAASSISSHFED